MRNVLNLSLRLAILMLAAALCLGVTNMVTQEPIRKQEQLLAEAMRAEVMPGASAFEEIEIENAPDSLLAAYKAVGSFGGYVFEMSTTGFSGAMSVTIGIYENGEIAGVRVGTHSETPGLGAKATEELFYGQYTGKSTLVGALSVVKKAPGEADIQAITASTITSRAVNNAVNDAIDIFIAIMGGI